MDARTAAHELASTIKDILHEGDPISHLAAWLYTVRQPTWEALAPIAYTLTPEQDTKGDPAPATTPAQRRAIANELFGADPIRTQPEVQRAAFTTKHTR